MHELINTNAAVQELLMTLPRKTKHRIMVPIGPLAFMPGSIVHSNELMVAIGDNHFVADRSAAETHDILGRRIGSMCVRPCSSRSLCKAGVSTSRAGRLRFRTEARSVGAGANGAA